MIWNRSLRQVRSLTDEGLTRVLQRSEHVTREPANDLNSGSRIAAVGDCHDELLRHLPNRGPKAGGCCHSWTESRKGAEGAGFDSDPGTSLSCTILFFPPFLFHCSSAFLALAWAPIPTQTPRSPEHQREWRLIGFQASNSPSTLQWHRSTQ